MAQVTTPKVMASKMTAEGVSTTTAPGTEQYEIFYNAYRPRRKHYQYDYRHTDGELFCCVAHTLKECRRKRDEWLNNKHNTQN